MKMLGFSGMSPFGECLVTASTIFSGRQINVLRTRVPSDRKLGPDSVCISQDLCTSDGPLIRLRFFDAKVWCEISPPFAWREASLSALGFLAIIGFGLTRAAGVVCPGDGELTTTSVLAATG